MKLVSEMQKLQRGKQGLLHMWVHYDVACPSLLKKTTMSSVSPEMGSYVADQSKLRTKTSVAMSNGKYWLSVR